MALPTLALALATQAAPNPGAIVSKMLARYHNVPTLVGSIQFTQRAQGKSFTVKTSLQYERPAKLSVRQSSSRKSDGDAFIVSDGKWFTYTLPSNMIRNTNDKALVEPIRREGITFDVGRIYITGSASLLDNSAPLAIAIGRIEDLRFLRSQWATVTYDGRAKVGQEDVDLIGGDWRQYAGVPPSGRYQMAISSSGALLRFVLKERYAPDPNRGPIDIESSWAVQLEPKATPDPKAFAIPKA